MVYERLIDNRIGDGVEDLRTPILGGAIPFVYVRRCSLQRWFGNGDQRVSLASADQLLAPAEQECLLHFAGSMGLDCGEVDVVRDRGSGRFYVVDVKDTPNGPPSGISPEDGDVASLI